jgi:hypothetical protein
MIKFTKKHKYTPYDSLKEKILNKIADKRIFLHSIRKARNRADAKRFKVQLCFYQRVERPEKSLLAELNQGDPRFDGNILVAWMIAEPSYIEKQFEIPVERMAALEIFSASNIPMAAWEKDKHFLWMGHEGLSIDFRPLNIQVFEYTENENYMHDLLLQPKCNPKTGEVVTHGGHPVYRVLTVVKGPPKHRFLEGDTLAQRVAFASAGASSGRSRRSPVALSEKPED